MHRAGWLSEGAIQSVQSQARVMKLAPGERWNVEIPSKRAVVPWMVERAV